MNYKKYIAAVMALSMATGVAGCGSSSDTRLHVAATTIDKLMDYTFNTPSDPLRSVDCVKQRCELIRKNLEYLNK